jgi:hypothetical protein
MGTVLAFGLILLLLSLRKGKGSNGGLVPKKADLPADKPGMIGTPVPVKPTTGLVGTKVGTPAGVGLPTAGAAALQISNDCKTVVIGPQWWADVAQPRAAQLVAQGVGVNPYTSSNAERSLDAAVRTIVAESTGVACINDAPWLDRYIKTHPIPVASADDTREMYLFQLKQWDDIWNSVISGWAAAHPAVFDLFKKVGSLVLVTWANGANVNPLTVGAPGTLPAKSKATPADKLALQELGYSIVPGIVETFQFDYNLVQNYRTDFGWANAGLQIKEDDVVGSETREALQEALMLDAGLGGWPLIEAVALRELGQG